MSEVRLVTKKWGFVATVSWEEEEQWDDFIKPYKKRMKAIAREAENRWKELKNEQSD